MSDDLANIIARAVVGAAAMALVTKLIGPKAGIVSTIAVLAAHEAFDAPVVSLLTNKRPTAARRF